MTDSESRIWRPVLSGGVVMIYGRGFEHCLLVGHVGEIIGIGFDKNGQADAVIQHGGTRLELYPITDLVGNTVFH